MPIICHFERHAGYSGVMLGMPNERFHLEFTHADTGVRALLPPGTICLFSVFQIQKPTWEQ